MLIDILDVLSNVLQRLGSVEAVLHKCAVNQFFVVDIVRGDLVGEDVAQHVRRQKYHRSVILGITETVHHRSAAVSGEQSRLCLTSRLEASFM